MRRTFRATVWRYPGDAGWHFATLPPDLADEIDDHTAASQRGFGSVRVEVELGTSRWKTSLFPSKDAGSFVLPVKKPVRTAEGIDDGDEVEITVTVLDPTD
ncbi:MAG: DUF1905 domain-containing protein [Acidimicrobiales bacterium]